MGYESIPGFEAVLLEDSFVLDVAATPGRLDLRIDLMVLPDHPAYRPPRPGEVACFVRAAIRFVDVTVLTWSDQGRPVAVDASGEIDYGGFYDFDGQSGDWTLIGEWGHLRVEGSPAPTIELLDEDEGDT